MNSILKEIEDEALELRRAGDRAWENGRKHSGADMHDEARKLEKRAAEMRAKKAKS